MPADPPRLGATEERWRDELLAGELSPAEYAAQIVAPPSLRMISPRYRLRRRLSTRGPGLSLGLALVLVSWAVVCCALLLAARAAGADPLVSASLAALAVPLAFAPLLARWSAAQEIWLLSDELRRQRASLDAYEVYGDSLKLSLGDLVLAESRGLSADFIHESLERTRVALMAKRQADVVLAILGKQAGAYAVAYASLPRDSHLDAELDRLGAGEGDLLERLDPRTYTHLVPFEFVGSRHELLALSTAPFSRAERWALAQLAGYCSAAGTLARIWPDPGPERRPLTRGVSPSSQDLRAMDARGEA